MSFIQYLKNFAFGILTQPYLTSRMIINRPNSWHFRSKLSLCNKRILANYINENQVDTVVDLGCGTMDLNNLIKPNIKYIGLDNDPGLSATFHTSPSFIPVTNNNSNAYLDLVAVHHQEIALVAFNILHGLSDTECKELISRFISLENYKLFLCDEISDAFVGKYQISKNRLKNMINELNCEYETVPCDDTRCILVLKKK